MPDDSRSGALLILCSSASEEEAGRIAARLVEERLAACVNVLPGVQSTYRWQGAVERAKEALLVIKTSRAHLEEVEKLVLELHSYELPEFLAIDAAGGSAAYLEWLAGTLK